MQLRSCTLVKEANYSFTYGGAHIVTLGIGYIEFGRNAACFMKEPYQWLDKNLSAAVSTSKVRNIIGIGHIIEPYSSRNGCLPTSRELGAIAYTNILDKHKAALVLAGHNHSWQRTYPIDHQGDTTTALGKITTQEKSIYKNCAGVIYQTISSPYYLHKSADWPYFAFVSGAEKEPDSSNTEDYGTLQVSDGGRKMDVKCYRRGVCVDSYSIERDISISSR